MKKHFLVVGGSHGIGLQIAKDLIAEGYSVTVLSRSKGELESTHGAEHIACDVTTDALYSLSFDSLDGLVYCPGTINLKPFHRIKPAEFGSDFQLNVMGGVKLIQHLLPALKKGAHPSALFFSTVAVSQGMPFHSSIAMSKGAIEGLTRSLAAELAPHVRVNCIAPSITDTPLASRLLNTEEKKTASGQKHPLNRVGEVQDIAHMAAFLLSEKSSWITGQVIGVDGGMSTIRAI